MTREYFLTCMDPGGETGLSLFQVRPEAFELLDYATVLYEPRRGTIPTTKLREWRLGHPGVHHFLYEDFHMRNTQEAAATDDTALKVIGAVDQMIYDHRPYGKIFELEPVEAKHMTTDEKLELLDLHLGHKYDQRHVRDANRHFVAHMTQRRYLPVCGGAFTGRTGPSSASRARQGES